MRIRRRLVLYAVGVATLGMVLFATLLVWLASGGVAADQRESLAALADDTATAIARTSGTEAADRPLLVDDLRTSVDPFIVVTDPDGTVRYATAEVDGEAPRLPAAVVVEAIERGRSSAEVIVDDDLEVAVAAVSVTRADGSTVVVAAGQPTAFARQQVGGLLAFLILAGIITVIVVAIVSWLVIGRALRPLRALTATVDEIRATGDLGRRLPATTARDEVGTLTTSFNAMLEEVAEAQARQAAVLDAQRRFVADASHELRTPLTTIRTNAEFLAEHPEVDASDRQAAVGDVAAEAARMARLVDDLLVLARSDAGTTLALRPLDLAGLADEVVQRAARSTPGRTITYAGAGPAIVAGDPESLTRLLWIVIDNAIRHGAGAIEVRVEVIGAPGAGAVGSTGGAGSTGVGAVGSARLTVSDRGPGIAAADRDRVFARFSKTDASRASGGSGLGLAIARSITDAHGGSIAIGERDGGGTTVTVELPIAG